MTTAGELLASMGGGSGSSALSNLVAASSSTGTGQTVYATLMTVMVEDAAMAITDTTEPPIMVSVLSKPEAAWVLTKERSLYILEQRPRSSRRM
jgi:hypothetical protein